MSLKGAPMESYNYKWTIALVALGYWSAALTNGAVEGYHTSLLRFHGSLYLQNRLSLFLI